MEGGERHGVGDQEVFSWSLELFGLLHVQMLLVDTSVPLNLLKTKTKMKIKNRELKELLQAIVVFIHVNVVIVPILPRVLSLLPRMLSLLKRVLSLLPHEVLYARTCCLRWARSLEVLSFAFLCVSTSLCLAECCLRYSLSYRIIHVHTYTDIVQS